MLPPLLASAYLYGVARARTGQQFAVRSMRPGAIARGRRPADMLSTATTWLNLCRQAGRHTCICTHRRIRRHACDASVPGSRSMIGSQRQHQPLLQSMLRGPRLTWPSRKAIATHRIYVIRMCLLSSTLKYWRRARSSKTGPSLAKCVLACLRACILPNPLYFFLGPPSGVPILRWVNEKRSRTGGPQVSKSSVRFCQPSSSTRLPATLKAALLRATHSLPLNLMPKALSSLPKMA